jgi:transposase
LPKLLDALAKTDQLDAATLAQFGAAIRPPAQPLRSDEHRALAAILDACKSSRMILSGEDSAVVRTNSEIAKDIKSHTAWIEKRLRKIDEDLGNRVKRTPLLRDCDELFQSVPGVGTVVSHSYWPISPNSVLWTAERFQPLSACR